MYSLFTVVSCQARCISVSVLSRFSRCTPCSVISPQEQCIGVYVPSLFSRCTPCSLSSLPRNSVLVFMYPPCSPDVVPAHCRLLPGTVYVFLYSPCSPDVLPAHCHLLPGTVYQRFCSLPFLQIYSLLTVFSCQVWCMSVSVPFLFSRCTTCCHLLPGTVYKCFCTLPVLQMYSLLTLLFPGTMYRCLCSLHVLHMYSLLTVVSSQVQYVNVPLASLFCRPSPYWLLSLPKNIMSLSIYPPYSADIPVSFQIWMWQTSISTSKWCTIHHFQGKGSKITYNKL